MTTAPPASATPVWSVTPSPSPAGPVSGNLAGVACPSTTTCFAVGGDIAGSAGTTLVERWNGNKWSVVASPNPSGSNGSVLNGVSCVSASRCFAVGYSFTASGVETLVERWDGTSWSIVASPNPGGSVAGLFGVSCPSTTSCYAVGVAGFFEKTLVERWDGTSWSIVASANPSGTSSIQLTGVACRNATRCFAVGSYSAGNTSKTLVERWNGTSWSIVASSNPSGSNFSNLSGVTCPITTSCFAVGNYSSGNTGKTLVERWDGTGWSIVASPNPGGSNFSSLSGVTCPSATRCFAVGNSYAGSTGKTLVERWNGTTWSIVASPNLSTSFDALSSVACPESASCYAVGATDSYTLVEHWDGTSWSIAASPTSSSQSRLAAVACPSASSCYAVGSYQTGSAGKTLVEHWNGTTWSIVKSPNPSGSVDSALSGVSCPSATSCFAVGSSSIGATTRTLVERWDGTTWSIVASPNPSGSNGSVLNGVSCASTTSCYAVGFSGFFEKTLVEHWDGTSWSIVASPEPSGADLVLLAGVSCASATSCSAVGAYLAGSDIHTLVERWDGTSWSVVASPDPAGGTGPFLNGVSCASATRCEAVGDYSTTSSTKTLVEHWNGTSWSIVASPNPPAAAGILSGVSCASATSCDAVGSHSTSSSTGTLVEHWDGTGWSIVASPHPASATGSVLSGVSCPSTTSCYAVGDFLRAHGDYTLTERKA